MEWLKIEIENFSGDNNLIIITGNSPGGSAMEYLLVSPAIPYNLFNTAIFFVSSAEPYYTKNMNLNVSFSIIQHINLGFNKF